MSDITKGTWGLACVEGDNPTIKADGLAICYMACGQYSNTKANANLIAEAGTVHNETGLSPRQLLEQRDALLDVCKRFKEMYIQDTDLNKQTNFYVEVCGAIARAGGDE